jgi:hypothetical protein
MKVVTLKVDRDNPTEISVHLDFMATLHAVAGWVFWYAVVLFLGAALERAYLLTHR